MIPLVYDVLARIFSFIVGIFFREIRVRGVQNIPKYGPVIFVVAPHNSQFCDPLLLIRSATRRVSFLAAQKSMDRKFIGACAKALGAIGVVRAQDIAKKMKGTIRLADPINHPDVIEGLDTDFVAAANAGLLARGHSIMINIPLTTARPSSAGGGGGGAGSEPAMAKGGDVSLEIAAVESATRIRLARAVTDPDVVAALSSPMAWKCAPKVDYGKMYEAVTARLCDGRCIAIFPEGGSHDRPELLPFKAGVAIMALGAMAAHPGLDVKLVPVGLSYFHADRFRSRAGVEYGPPISVPTELIRKYASGGADKRLAAQALLDVIQAAVANVTVSAPDFQTLMVVQAVRRMYRPLNRKLTLIQKLELTRRLMKGYIHYKQDPRVKDLEQKVVNYNQLLSYHGLKDHQVERTAIGGFRALGLLLYRLVLLAIMGLVALPGTLLNAPIAIAASRISKQKAKEALAASTVKIEGRDVIATWKLLVALVLVPLIYAFYTFVTWILVYFVFGVSRPWTWLAPLLVFWGLPYISLIALSWGETGADIYKSLAPLMYSILPTRWSSSLTLRHARAELVRDLNEVINQLGPTLFPDFRTFFLRDTEIAPAQQSAVGLKRVSSWVSSWLVPQAGSPSGLNLVVDGETLARDLTHFFIAPTTHGYASPSSPAPHSPVMSEQDLAGLKLRVSSTASVHFAASSSLSTTQIEPPSSSSPSSGSRHTEEDEDDEGDEGIVVIRASDVRITETAVQSRKPSSAAFAASQDAIENDPQPDSEADHDQSTVPSADLSRSTSRHKDDAEHANIVNIASHPLA